AAAAPASRPHDAPEAEVTGGGVHGLRHAGSRAVPPAVVRRAQVGTALDHLAGDADVRRVRVVARVAFPAARVRARAAGTDSVALLLVPIARPLPDVAGHLVEPVAVGRERAHGRGPLEAVQ